MTRSGLAPRGVRPRIANKSHPDCLARIRFQRDRAVLTCLCSLTRRMQNALQSRVSPPVPSISDPFGLVNAINQTCRGMCANTQPLRDISTSEPREAGVADEQTNRKRPRHGVRRIAERMRHRHPNCPRSGHDAVRGHGRTLIPAATLY